MWLSGALSVRRRRYVHRHASTFLATQPANRLFVPSFFLRLSSFIFLFCRLVVSFFYFFSIPKFLISYLFLSRFQCFILSFLMPLFLCLLHKCFRLYFTTSCFPFLCLIPIFLLYFYTHLQFSLRLHLSSLLDHEGRVWKLNQTNILLYKDYCHLACDNCSLVEIYQCLERNSIFISVLKLKQEVSLKSRQIITRLQVVKFCWIVTFIHGVPASNLKSCFVDYVLYTGVQKTPLSW
jgi:hypothetical protein